MRNLFKINVLSEEIFYKKEARCLLKHLASHDRFVGLAKTKRDLCNRTSHLKRQY